MKREELVMACVSDVAGQVRGKAFPAADLDKRLRRGVGWTPTNVQITCFDAIADSPFGALGDLLLIPDPDARVRVDFADGSPVEHFVIGDVKHTDGRPWECCTRSILRQALQRLHAAAGLELIGAFEHEFQFRDVDGPQGSGYSLPGFRAQQAFGEALVAAMRAAGLVPDTFLREYGPAQYEITMGPQSGVAAADHAVILREMARATARRMARRITFTPIRDPASVGNGVHIHMSLRDAAGAPATHDPARPHGLSAVAGSFAAGVLAHLESILAFTAPSLISYARLTPHRWSSAFNNLGFRDREAAVRICPVSSLSDVDVSEQYNIEFRAGDAAASPYLQLAAIVHAGAQGIEDGLATPQATEEDLSVLAVEALAARGLVRLPQSLPEALERLAASATVRGWFPDGFVDVYLRHKAGEMNHVKALPEAERFLAYENVY